MTFNMRLKNLSFLYLKRQLSTEKITNEAVRKMRCDMFTTEKQRQASLVTRIEKIEVHYKGLPKDCSLYMNKKLSTPFECAMHMHEMHCKRSVLAEVNGELWDLHRPLTENCELRFLNFHDSPKILNKVFWRSCSFLLGMIIEKAFKEDFFINLHSWPKPNVKSGSYVYDVDIGIPNWEPTPEELKVFTTMLCRISAEDNNFERLDVSEDLALEMFQHNPFKSQQIPQLGSAGFVTLYRVKDHVDISCGPMIANTKFVGTTQFAAVHHLESECGYRFQAVSIPKQLTLSSFAFGVLVDRAKKLNETGLSEDSTDKNEVVSHVERRLLPDEDHVEDSLLPDRDDVEKNEKSTVSG